MTEPDVTIEPSREIFVDGESIGFGFPMWHWTAPNGQRLTAPFVSSGIEAVDLYRGRAFARTGGWADPASDPREDLRSALTRDNLT